MHLVLSCARGVRTTPSVLGLLRTDIMLLKQNICDGSEFINVAKSRV